MTAFVDEFRNDPTILRAALEAAVGPLPDVEVLETGWIKVDGRLCAPSSSRALDTAREALAVLVASARLERDAAAAGQAPHLATPPNAEGIRVPLDDVKVTTDADGVHVTGRLPAALADVLSDGPINVSVRGPRCGDVDPDEGACLLDPGHAGAHFYTMGRLS